MKILLLLLILFQFGGKAGVGGKVGTGGGIPPPFLPTSLTGLQLWFSADCITIVSSVCTTPSTGTSITFWADRSGNNNNASGGSNKVFNTSQINGLPAVTFTPTAILTLASQVAPSAGHTAFAVIQNLVTNSKLTVFGGALNGFAYYACDSNPTFNHQGVDAQMNVAVGNSSIACDTSWHQRNVTMTNAGSPTFLISFRLDEASDALSTSTSASIGGNGPVVIGANGYNSTELLNAKVAELIYYNRTLNSTEIGKVEAYLHSRYNL